MHKRIIALLFVALVIFVSGCISGSTIKRQAAETEIQADNLSLYYEPEPAREECTCPDSFRTCGDGFNTTCENSCANDACSRCVPDCTGHSSCNEAWFCGEWQPCSGSTQTRRCIDSNFCNRTAVIETRKCPDSCSSDAGCPAGSGCSAYICRGSPKSCERVVMVPCCGDGVCDAGESCQQDCPSQQAQQNQGTTNPTNTTNPSYAPNVSITNITYKPPEFVEIWNLGSGSADMTNWTLRDNTTVSSHVFKFLTFALAPNSSVRVHTEDGTNNNTDIFWGTSSIWNDKGGDVAYLKDKNSILISIYSYNS